MLDSLGSFAWIAAPLAALASGAFLIFRGVRSMGRGRVVGVTGVAKANELVGKIVVESKLPSMGAPKSDGYEGDGYIVVRDPSTDVVKRALKILVETVRVHYAWGGPGFTAPGRALQWWLNQLQSPATRRALLENHHHF